MSSRKVELGRNQARVLASDRPLTALWERSIDPETTTLRHEFVTVVLVQLFSFVSRSLITQRNVRYCAAAAAGTYPGMQTSSITVIFMVTVQADQRKAR